MSTPPWFSPLTLLGAPHPVAPVIAPPRPIGALLTTWGAGRLCGLVDVFALVPEDAAWVRQQARLAGPARQRRARGDWAQVDEARFAELVAIGVDAAGALLVAAPGDEALHLLAPDGIARSFASTDALVRDALLGAGDTALTKRQVEHQHITGDGRRTRTTLTIEPGVPAAYAARAPSDAAPDDVGRAIVDALVAADEPRADAALGALLERDVTLFAALDVLAAIGRCSAIGAELRIDFARQVLALVRRRVKVLVRRDRIDRSDKEPDERPHADAELGLDAIMAIIEAGGEADAAAVARLEDNRVRQPRRGLFVDDAPSDDALLPAGAPLTTAGSAPPSSPPPSPLADAEARGFVAPPGTAPIDGEAAIARQVEAWRAEAPDVDIAPLLDAVRALHPGERQGVAVLIHQLHGPYDRRHASTPGSVPSRPPAYAHLEREVRRAWPMLVLALRGTTKWIAQGIRTLLEEQRVTDAAPFVLSVVRHAGVADQVEEDFATTYVALVDKVPATLIDELVPYLRPPATLALHGGDVARHAALRLAAAILLESHVRDDRVLLGFLESFVATHPVSERALRKRAKDPRIDEVLLAQLDAEEEKARFMPHSGPHKDYDEEFEILARFLAKRKHPRAVDALARYRKYMRWMEGRPL